eukprot:6344909-Heterocapsa_arctica.AAC.1
MPRPLGDASNRLKPSLIVLITSSWLPHAVMLYSSITLVNCAMPSMISARLVITPRPSSPRTRLITSSWFSYTLVPYPSTAVT